MPAVAALAAFSHHLMITAMMLPIMMRLARVQNLSPSRLLMPMSLAASLGTTLTLFSAPAFLLMNHLLQTGKQETLGILGITPIGAALVVLAIIYMSVGRWILPKRKARADEADYLRLDRYYTEVIVEAKSRWIDQPIADFNRYYDGRLEVVEWLRNGVPQHNKNRGSVLARGRRAVCQRHTGRNRLGRERTGPCTSRSQEIRRVDRAGPRRRAAAGAGRRGAALSVHRRDDRRGGLPQDLRRRGRGHVAPAGLDSRPPVPGEIERGRPAGAARHAGPVRGARIPSRHPDDGAVLRAATASPACGAHAPDRDRGRGCSRVRRRPGTNGIPRRRCCVGPDRLRQRRSRLSRDRRAHLRDDRRRHSAGSRNGADRDCGLPRGTAPAGDRWLDARSQ